MNLICNITSKERSRQTLCDKRDNIYVWKIFPTNFTFFQTNLFVKAQKPVILKEDHDKTRRYQPCQAFYTQTFRIPLLSAVLPRKRTTMIGNLLVRKQGFDRTLWGHFFVLQAITG